LCYEQCPKNSFRRLYIVKGLLVLVEKASFSKEFRSEFQCGGEGDTFYFPGLCISRMRILSGIQFTTYFVKFVVVETKQFVSSSVNVILTQQTCGQSISRDAEGKRRARKSFFHANLLHVLNIKMLRTLISWSVHFLGICDKETAAQCQTPILFVQAQQVFF